MAKRRDSKFPAKHVDIYAIQERGAIDFIVMKCCYEEIWAWQLPGWSICYVVNGMLAKVSLHL